MTATEIRSLSSLTRDAALARANALIAERDSIWSKVTGSTTHGRGAKAEIEVHGVTGDEISRVARINSMVTFLRSRYDLYGVVRA